MLVSKLLLVKYFKRTHLLFTKVQHVSIW